MGHELKLRLAGAYLSWLWTALYPLLLLGCYGAVYLFVYDIKLPTVSSQRYVLLIFAGLIPFLAFVEALNSGVVSIVSNRSLIRNTLFPVEMIPLKNVIASQASAVFSFCFLIIFQILSNALTVYALLVPFFLFFQILLCIGLAWFLAPLNLYARDIQQATSIVLLALMMLSPIAYSADMVPDNVRSLLMLNPLFYYITAFQDILVYGRLPSPIVIAVAIGLGLFVFFSGYFFIIRMKELFVDSA